MRVQIASKITYTCLSDDGRARLASKKKQSSGYDAMAEASSTRSMIPHFYLRRVDPSSSGGIQDVRRPPSRTEARVAHFSKEAHQRASARGISRGPILFNGCQGLAGKLRKRLPKGKEGLHSCPLTPPCLSRRASWSERAQYYRHLAGRTIIRKRRCVITTWLRR